MSTKNDLRDIAQRIGKELSKLKTSDTRTKLMNLVTNLHSTIDDVETQKCGACNGSGKCPDCDGTGEEP